MRIIDFKISDFRNINNLNIVPSENLNLIYGENGQGKTNILEAIWLCTGAKSFRNAKTAEFVNFEKYVSFLENSFIGFNRNQEIKMKINTKKYAFLNGVELDSSIKLAGNFCCVAFSPSHLSLVSGGPEERRKFIDSSICQFKPNYIIMLSRYKRIMLQKNSLLKKIDFNDSDETKENYNQLLDVYDKQLAYLSCLIYKERFNYIEKLKISAKKIYNGISNEKEELEIEYKTNFENKNENDLYYEIKEKRKREIFIKYSIIGIHRDDIDIKICQKNAKSFASQGQKRSCVLSLKIAESEILTEKIGEEPIILLDDVLSELDKMRQDYLLNKILNKQVFITCCDKNNFNLNKKAKLFEINNGSLK